VHAASRGDGIRAQAPLLVRARAARLRRRAGGQVGPPRQGRVPIDGAKLRLGRRRRSVDHQDPAGPGAGPGRRGDDGASTVCRCRQRRAQPPQGTA
ncbi:hypothetical protein BN1723_020062, partial [Verticillium longisporum]